MGQVLEIVITLSGYKFGHFTLPISCHFQGTDPLSLRLQGTVIAPKLEFDVERVDFGTISYGFENTQIVCLHNDSDIPVKFKAYIPLDESKREFAIKLYAEEEKMDQLPENDTDETPTMSQEINESELIASDLSDERGGIIRNKGIDDRNIGEFDGFNFNGCIYPHSSINLQILFKSVSVKKYKDYKMMIDIENVGDKYLSVPISANCVVPEIHIEEKEIDLNRCYLKYEYSGTVTIRNDNDLPVTYQFIPQNEKTKKIAVIEFDEPICILQPKEKKSLKYQFFAERLGECNISSYVSVIGSTKPPLLIKFHFIGIGPALKLSLKKEPPSIPLTSRSKSSQKSHRSNKSQKSQNTEKEDEELTKINFGNIEALKTHERVLLIQNICPIDACIHAEVYKDNSCYTIDIQDAIIKPNEILPIKINVFLNDTVKVNDDLMITVNEGNDIVLSLLSRGIGTTLVPSIDMNAIDFANQFTNNKCSKSFRIENRGKRCDIFLL